MPLMTKEKLLDILKYVPRGTEIVVAAPASDYEEEIEISRAFTVTGLDGLVLVLTDDDGVPASFTVETPWRIGERAGTTRYPATYTDPEEVFS